MYQLQCIDVFLLASVLIKETSSVLWENGLM